MILLLALVTPTFWQPAPPIDPQAPAQAPAAAAPAAPAEPKWTGSFALSASYSDGNTERRSVSATGDAEYRRPKDRTSFGFLWSYADDDTGITERKTQGRAKYDYFFNAKNYGLAQASAENDFQATLDLRTTIGVGFGHQFADSEDWKFSGELGVSYVDESYVNQSDDANFTAARAAYKWAWKSSDKFTLGQEGEIFPSLEDPDDVNARVDTKARLNLTAKMFAQLEWLFQWDNTPAAGKERADNLVLLGVGWSF